MILLTALAGLIAARCAAAATPHRLRVVRDGSMLAMGVLLLAPSEFYDHYAAFFAPFLALTLGGAVGRSGDGRRCAPRCHWPRWRSAVLAFAANQLRIIYGEHGTD